MANKKKIAQSVEPKVADTVNGWLKSYGLEYYLQHESMGAEIDYALEKAESKNGGQGGNKPDAKLLLQDSKLDYYPVMIEYKGYKDKLELLDSNGHVANTKADNTPNYNNISKYAVNGAVHYANAILQFTSFTDIISIGVTGYQDSSNILRLKIGVYYVGKENYGEGRKVGEYSDLSFLKKEHFDNFVKSIRELSIDKDDLRRIHLRRENQIEDALKKINDNLFKKQEKLSSLSRIHLVAASIMANLGIPGKVKPLKESDLLSSTEEGETDGDKMMRKIETFLRERELPEPKVKAIVNSLYVTVHNENLSKPRNGTSALKEIFTEIVDDLGCFYKIGLDTDFTGKLFNTMFRWLSFAGDDQNDVVITPWYVAHFMAKLCRVNMDSYVWDFATGSAGLLVAAMHQMLEDAKANIKSPDKLVKKLDSIKKTQILGVEVLPEIYMLAVLNMILMGDGSSNILEEDSLVDYDGNYGYGKNKDKKFPADVFLLNPPYSADGKGMVFVERALSMMNKGYAAVIIQDSAGIGQATDYNKKILKNNTLLASIKMPKDLFRGKSNVQTSIYVFRVGERHESESVVRFIDFSNDGYKRAGRKNAKASKNLKDESQAEERYKEVVNLVKNGGSKLRLLTHEEFVEDTIDINGQKCGNDWNFDQHKKKQGEITNEVYTDIIGEYLLWEVSCDNHNQLSICDYDVHLHNMKKEFFKKGGSWEKKAVNKLFKVDNTASQKNRESVDYLTPIVTNSSKNNGITRYVNLKPTEDGGVITFSDTTTTKAIFYQPKPFIGFSHVKKLTPIRQNVWSENCCLFFIANLKHEIDGLFNYDHKLNVMSEIKVPLPVINGDIAFDFMENYVKELKLIHLKMIKDEFEIRYNKYVSFIS